MTVRLEIQRHTLPESYWQLKRCRVQRAAMMEDVSDPAFFRPMRFGTFEDTIFHAKRATFSYLEKKRHKEMPDQIDWRIIQDDHIFPCPCVNSPCTKRPNSDASDTL